MSPVRSRSPAPLILSVRCPGSGGEIKGSKALQLYPPEPEGYNGFIMTSNLENPSMSEVCARVRHLGYAVSGRIRLYGEEFEVVSDPFPEADGIAIHVTTKKDSKIRVLQIPATVLQSVRGRGTNAA